jgi:predicted enzyme involved in methoxymalonyl-ACP biosynthesis
MKSFIQLQRNIKKDFSHLKKVKVALLGDTATQFLRQSLVGMGYDYGFELQILEADFNQIERQVLDTGSELYDFSPELVIIFHSSHKLLSKYNKLDPSEYSQLANSRISLIGMLYSTLKENLPAKIIYFNNTEIDDAIFGNYANKLESSFYFSCVNLTMS